MRTLLIGFALFAVPGVVVVACRQDLGTSATASGNGFGGAPNCEGVYLVTSDKDGGNPCDICLHDNCCAEIAQCRDKACIDCVNYLQPGCSDISKAVSHCADDHCLATCSPGWPPSTATSGTGG